MTGTPLRFPDGFLWGAATAAHQTEGNNVNTDWWVAEHRPGTHVTEPSGDACDSYHRYREDMALLSGAGLGSYRFSIEWARIEPEPGFFSQAAIDHYRRMVEAARELGLTPVVTLHHFTHPRWMADRGGWHHPDAASRFAAYTEAALPVLDGVEWVVTINEPNILAMELASSDGPPIRERFARGPSPDLSQTLAVAHQQSRAALSTLEGVRSGWTVATQAYQAAPDYEGSVYDFGYWRDYFFLEAARGDDFVGVQAYTRTIVGPDGMHPPAPGVETTLTGWEYYPRALEEGVRSAWELAGQIPVVVTENGIATADDARRIDYTRGALVGLHEAMADGVDVRGYLHWSALDNYEWGRYAPTFGLVAVDRRTFERTPKPSLAWLGEVARTGTVHAQPEDRRPSA